MKLNLLITCVLTLLMSCNSEINQYRKEGNKTERSGGWIEKDSTDDGLYLTKGRYRHNKKVGVWKTYLNGKPYQKNKIKDSIIKTRIYFSSGKKKADGQSKLIIKEKYRHCL